MDPKKIETRRERKMVPRARRSVLDKSRASSAKLTTSFSPNRQALDADLLADITAGPFSLDPMNRPLDHVDRFALRFVIDPCHHFTEEAHAHQLYSQNQEEDREQQERPPANRLAREQFEAGQIQGDTSGRPSTSRAA